MLGIELRSSHLSSEHFANEAVSPTPRKHFLYVNLFWEVCASELREGLPACRVKSPGWSWVLSLHKSLQLFTRPCFSWQMAASQPFKQAKEVGDLDIILD